MINDEISKIANQASLKIFSDNKTVNIKHKFNWRDKSVWGVLFFLVGGVFLIIFPFIKSSDTTSKLLGVLLGLSLLTWSILAIIRQVADRVEITNKLITIRLNLKQTSFPLNGNMKLIMKTDITNIRRVGTLGSDFIIITHYLKDLDKQIPILRFQMNKLDKDNALKLGNEIKNIINSRIQQCN